MLAEFVDAKARRGEMSWRTKTVFWVGIGQYPLEFDDERRAAFDVHREEGRDAEAAAMLVRTLYEDLADFYARDLVRAAESIVSPLGWETRLVSTHVFTSINLTHPGGQLVFVGK